jgi:Ni/Co efflux regulator RcnB
LARGKAIRRLSDPEERKMKKTLIYVVTCASLALPFAAMAAMTDAQYCEALSVEYRKLNTDASTGPQADAMAQCKAGNTAAGIPVLEKALKDGKVTLPSRN